MYLTVIAGVLARFYEHRGIPTADVTLRTCVPVSTRTTDERGQLGNRVTQVFAPLPLGLPDPVERHKVISEAMSEVKASGVAEGTETLASLEVVAPPVVLALLSRLHFSNRFFNLVTTNVPGFAKTLSVFGAPVREMHPMGYLNLRNALVVVVASYAGSMEFGFVADAGALPEVDRLSEWVVQSSNELLAAVSEVAPIVPKEEGL